MNRRDFLRSSAALAALAPFARAQPATGKKRALKKGFMYGTFGGPNLEKLKIADRFTLLRAAGFDGVEVNSAMNQSEVLAARDQSGLAIPSVVVSTHWAKPLSDPNPATREIGLEGLKQGLRDAKAYGASSVLLVPAVVTKETSYADAYTRSVAEIAKAVPLAESLGVVIAIENVWNRFLLSPLEAVAYADSFKSPFVRWHFDVGNVVNTGWPEHWIRTLGPRVVQIHVKEYSRKIRDEKGPVAGFRVDLFEGDSDWPKVLAALDEIGYSGWMITEQYRPPGLEDAAWLAQLSAKLDAVIAS
jgi:hexulose-6-phosphate isomerase